METLWVAESVFFCKLGWHWKQMIAFWGKIFTLSITVVRGLTLNKRVCRLQQSLFPYTLLRHIHPAVCDCVCHLRCIFSSTMAKSCKFCLMSNISRQSSHAAMFSKLLMVIFPHCCNLSSFSDCHLHWLSVHQFVMLKVWMIILTASNQPTFIACIDSVNHFAFSNFPVMNSFSFCIQEANCLLCIQLLLSHSLEWYTYFSLFETLHLWIPSHAVYRQFRPKTQASVPNCS